jgi:hypothetical protein
MYRFLNPLIRVSMLVVLGLSIPSNGLTQDECPSIAELIEQSVPSQIGNHDIMSRYLKPDVDEQIGIDRIDFKGLFNVLGEKTGNVRYKCNKKGQTCKMYNKRTQSRMQFNGQTGRITYFNPTRRFEGRRGESANVSQDLAMQVSTRLLSAFAVPEFEQTEPVVRTLKAASNDTAGEIPTQVLTAEEHVWISRSINGLPVVDSRSMIAVGDQNTVARAYIRWRPFVMLANLSIEGLLSRDQVLDQTIKLVAESNAACDIARIDADLVYAPAELVPGVDSDVAGYLPALRIIVTPQAVVTDTGISTNAEQVLIVLLFENGHSSVS